MSSHHNASTGHCT